MFEIDKKNNKIYILINNILKIITTNLFIKVNSLQYSTKINM